MKNVTIQVLIGIIRHILTFAGGALVAQGVISQKIETIGIGAICGLIGFVWSIAHKNSVVQAIKDAEDAAGLQQ